MKKLKSKQGFTLIELVVVMAIIAVLAVLVIGAITVARRSSTEAANRANARTLQACLEGFYAKNKKYCGTTGFACATGATKSVTANIAGVSNATDGIACTASAGTEGTGDTLGGGTVSILTATTYTIQVANYAGSVTSPIDTFLVQ